MTQIKREEIFKGLSKFFPESAQKGVVELERRLTRYIDSMFLQFTSQPTVFTGESTPEGPKLEDVWITSTATYIYTTAGWTLTGT